MLQGVLSKISLRGKTTLMFTQWIINEKNHAVKKDHFAAVLREDLIF